MAEPAVLVFKTLSQGLLFITRAAAAVAMKQFLEQQPLAG
jgi:hypothetical protein